MKTRSVLVDVARGLSPHEAAAIIGVDAKTLNNWRCERKGPPFVRVSARCIRYPADKLAAWIESRVVVPETANS